MKKLLLSHFLFLIPYFLLAQQFGGNPPSVKWKQINTDTARIIFPEGMDSTAQRVASVIHYLAKNNPAPLGSKVFKVNIVLQAQTTIANGYVALAPYRSEFFLTPPLNNFDLGSIPWPEALAVHEYRHVEQYNNFRNGLSKLAYYLFGEEGWLIGINASVPDWFYEGDAVYNETAVTHQGRGRIPLFLNEFKSLWLYQKDYKWMKLRNGSLKDYVPSHYPLGYLLVNYGREKYGSDFWTKVTRDASAFKGLFYPFQQAVKKYSGVDYKTFREEAFGYYRKLSGVESGVSGVNKVNKVNRVNKVGEDSSVNKTTIQNLTSLNEKFVTNYYFPYQVGNDSLLYLKTSYRQRNAFYIKDSRGERRLRVKDISMDQQYSYRNGRIVYAAFEPDTRWGWRDYSVIKILDIQNGQQRTLSRRTKYFTPDISPDGNSIAAVQVLPGGKSEIHILDANEGKLLMQFHSKEITLFTDPKFIDDRSLVTAVRLVDGRMALAVADMTTGSVERLTLPSYAVLGYPSVSNGVVYFTGSYSGNDEIYAVRLKDKKVYQLTQTALGNYFVNASAEKLVWSGFTADGYQLKEMESKDGIWNEVGELALTEQVTPFPLAQANEVKDILLNDVPDRKFIPSRYRQGANLFYVHSWRPYFEDPEFTYSIYSDNILNTFSTEFFYRHNRDERSNGIGVNFLYGALYPYINGGVEYTIDRPASVDSSLTTINELETRIGLSIPFDLTSGRSFKNLTIGTNYVLSNRIFKGIYKDTIGTLGLSYLHNYITWSQQVQRTVQHIYPKFGYSLSLNHRNIITGEEGFQFIGNANIYLPGIHPAHSLVFTGSLQQTDTLHLRSLFSNRFVQARGYQTFYLSQLTKMWKVSANYHFPIIYPDWGFANLLYLQRIRGNAFYDLARFYSRDRSITADLRSTGGELFFDTKWWNEYALTFGLRVSHLLDDDLVSGRPAGSNWFEILVPIVIPR